MTACFVYITASNAEEARRIGRSLVEARLAACANVHERITSIYWWEGAVQEGEEAVLVAKTREDLLDEPTEKVRAVHSRSEENTSEIQYLIHISSAVFCLTTK